jgi:hypothetical protein
VGARRARRALGAPRAGLARPIALAAAAVVALAGCSYTVVVTPASPTTHDYPIEPTPWPNGTIGASGLRISPSLLSYIPISVGGSTLIEDVTQEIQALDDPAYAAAFTSYYAARINDITAPNWLLVTLQERKPDAQNEEFYAQWRDDWFKVSCSQAEGLGSASTETINDLTVDIGSCNGGVVSYVLALDNGVLVSMMDLGPRRLGRQLVQGIK